MRSPVQPCNFSHRGPQQQVIDGPNRRVDRLQVLPANNASIQANAADTDPLGTSNVCDEKFGNGHFQHFHCASPSNAKRALWAGRSLKQAPIAALRSCICDNEWSLNKIAQVASIASVSKCAPLFLAPHSRPTKSQAVKSARPFRAPHEICMSVGGSYHHTIANAASVSIATIRIAYSGAKSDMPLIKSPPPAVRYQADRQLGARMRRLYSGE